ncbi:MAG TPA: VCBS repeat-containing protein, partial [Dehalococcoidia bacterium]|nr:VCBS repeat-containing protein [Dehalococcoidia bacterium]
MGAISGIRADFHLFGDINGDGHVEIVEVGRNNVNDSTVAVSSFDASNSVSGWWGAIAGERNNSAGVVDYNGDGRDDLLIGSNDTWLPGNTNYSLGAPQNLDSVFTEIPTRQFDFSGDGQLDLLSHRALYIRTATGFTRVAYPAAALYAESFNVTDIDGDSNPEVILSTGSLLKIYEYQSGSFQERYSRTAGRDFLIGDLNDDDRPEVAVEDSVEAEITVLYFSTNFAAEAFTFADPEVDLSIDPRSNWGGTATRGVGGGKTIEVIPVRTVAKTGSRY